MNKKNKKKISIATNKKLYRYNKINCNSSNNNKMKVNKKNMMKMMEKVLILNQ
jgi:hypothetical protein